ncbi:hypothetical protein ACFIOY_29420 [Bradyrhizobium sp. TZ2]
MMALEVFAIYVIPFLIIGLAIRLFMKRYAVDLPEVEKQVGPKTKAQISLGSLAHRRLMQPHVWMAPDLQEFFRVMNSGRLQ